MTLSLLSPLVLLLLGLIREGATPSPNLWVTFIPPLELEPAL